MGNRQGQTTAEYAVLVAVVVAAVLAMQIYVKRGAMGRLRDAADQVGDQFTPHQTEMDFTRHYETKRVEDAADATAVGQTVTTIDPTKFEKQKNTAGRIEIKQKLDVETLAD